MSENKENRNNEGGKSEAGGNELCSDFQRSCSCCPTEMTGGSCCAAKVVEKLMARLEASEKREKELLERVAKAEEKMDGMAKKLEKYESAAAVETKNVPYQRLLSKFPSSTHCYFIKTSSLLQSSVFLDYLTVESSGKIYFSGGSRRKPHGTSGHFKITKNPDGSFAIFSLCSAAYLCKSTSGYGCYSRESNNIWAKFALHFDKPTGQTFGPVAAIRPLAVDGFITHDVLNDRMDWIDEQYNFDEAVKFQFVPVA